jgi:hypothetical protein
MLSFGPLQLMRMTTALAGLCLLACLVPVTPRASVGPGSPSADKPNFSGKWILEKSEGESSVSEASFVIVHNDPELRITVRSPLNGKEGSIVTYYTDGRGEINSTQLLTNPVLLAGKEPISSKTKWAGKTLVTRFSEEAHLSRAERFRWGKGRKFFDWTITWEMSRDGLLSKTATYIMTGVDRVSRPILFRRVNDFNKVVLRRAE